ncbi:MAG: class I SAM-dependent methyltransferase [Candidatus Aminicenantes bacterium]|nr:class I SAM-dependent methyltransferase [Candidatus Aminicenantes bacterium]
MKWYEQFFDGVAMDFWKAAVPEEWTRAEVVFLKESLVLAPGSSVLDVPCGFGRHALALAAEGIRVRGIDIAPACVEEVNARAKAANLPAEAVLGDLAGVDLGGPFDGAYCLGNSFGYFDPDDMLGFCRRVAAALRPAGRFVIHTAMAAESVLPDFREREWITAGDITCLMANGYDSERSVVETHYTFIRDGRVEKRSSEHYVYTVGEIGRLLAASGFRVLCSVGSPDGTPFEFKDPQLYIIAEKR